MQHAPSNPATTTLAASVKAASGLNVAVAVWLLVAPFVLGYSTRAAAFWNDIVIGVLVILFAGARVAAPRLGPSLSWTNSAFGVWLVAAPFALGYSDIRNALWNDIISGVVIAVLALWSALSTPGTRRLP